MRAALALVLAVALAAAEPPTLTRAGGMPTLAYDLGATSPWMPVLWERLRLGVPAGATRIGFTAAVALETPAGATDPTDLLTVQDGHGVSLAGTGFTVLGRTGSWSGAVAGGAVLQASFASGTDAAHVILLIKQVRYANLGGVRSLGNRRVRVVPTATVDGVDLSGAALELIVAPLSADQPPLVRWDDLPVPFGGEADLAPVAWWDGRPGAAEPICRLLGLTDNLALTAEIDGERREVGDSLAGAGQPFGWFTAHHARLQARAVLEPSTCTMQASDASGASSTVFAVPVVAASGTLSVVGDLPFQAEPGASFRLRASRSDALLVDCRTHPAAGQPLTSIAWPFTAYHPGDGVIDLTLSATTQTEVVGTAVIRAGSEEYLLPYRIAIRQGTAN